MRLFNRQKPEEEVKKQEDEIMQAGQAVEEWLRLSISKRIMENLTSSETQLKDALFEYDSKEYYRAQGTLKFIKSLRDLVISPLAERDMLLSSKKEEENG